MALRRYDPFGFSSIFDSTFERDPFFSDSIMPYHRVHNTLGNSPLWKHPGYQINEDDKEYSIAIDVPGVKADEMKMQLEENNRVLHLSGGRTFRDGNTFTETKFDKRFTIGTDVDLEKMKADLSEGVLTVTAPKKEPAKVAESKIIPITDSSKE